MQIIKGNLWDYWEPGVYPSSPICITTNCVLKNDGCLVMGAGIAKQAKQEWPEIDYIWGKMVSWYNNYPFFHKPANMVSFPTKFDWKDKSSLLLIRKSASILNEMIDFYKWQKLFIPGWPGCSNGGLEVDKVRPILEEIFGNRDNVLVVEPK